MNEERGPHGGGGRGGEGGDGGGLGRGDDEAAVGAGEQAAGRWPRPMLVSLTALAAIAALTLTVIVQSSAAKAGAGAGPGARTGASGSAAPAPPSPSATATRTGAAPAPTGTPPPASAPTPSVTPSGARTPAPSVQDALGALPGSGVGDLAVAVAELGGETVVAYDSGAGDDGGAGDGGDGDGDGMFDTASIVKVDILAALLLQAQAADRHLTARERELATSMIEVSDNDAALALWHTIGGSAGLDAANDTLGLDHTSGGPNDLWGLTRTTAGDQLTLLRAVFEDESPLSPASRSYVSCLMRSVTSGQRWGVSAADSDGSGFALKNGWLRRTATGLWDINSIGLVTYGGHRLLISVLSSGQRSQAAGIELVQDAAAVAAKAFAAAG